MLTTTLCARLAAASSTSRALERTRCRRLRVSVTASLWRGTLLRRQLAEPVLPAPPRRPAWHRHHRSVAPLHRRRRSCHASVCLCGASSRQTPSSPRYLLLRRRRATRAVCRITSNGRPRCHQASLCLTLQASPRRLQPSSSRRLLLRRRRATRAARRTASRLRPLRRLSRTRLPCASRQRLLLPSRPRHPQHRRCQLSPLPAGHRLRRRRHLRHR